MNDCVVDFQLLAKLATEAEELGVRIFNHQYSYMAFGSWSIVIGTTKNRIQYNWDGKEFYLAVSESKFQNSNSLPNWEPIKSSIGGLETSPASIFQHISDSMRERYAI